MRQAVLFVLLFYAALAPSAAQAAPAAPLRVGSDISYAPLEFYSGHAVRGFDYDLAMALGARLGRPVVFENHTFDDLIPALRAGRFDVVMSSMSDTRARERQVDFVDYFLAGSGLLVQAGNPQHVFALDSLCGMTVDLQKGTSQQTAVQAQSTACTRINLHPIRVLALPTDSQALQRFESGASAAHVSDYPVVAYLARTLRGGTAYVVAGRQFGMVPYGIAVAKKNGALRDRVREALRALIADGTYDKLLKKWGLEQGAMRSAPVNAGTLFASQ